jgi:luciferase family oxidoreductase group 1
MLPHYAPLKVAEVFRTLHAMFPGRIDLGVGRAPGGGQLEAFALRRDRETARTTGDDFPQQLAELRAFLHPERWEQFRSARGPHPFSQIRVAPDASGAPDLWLLGSSMWSAVTAAAEGLPYAFAHFFFGHSTRQAIQNYFANFHPGLDHSQPEAAAAIGVICAPTDEEAQYLAASVRLLQRRIRMDDRRPVAAPDDALRELDAVPTAPNPLLPLTAGSLDAPEETEWPRYFVGTPGDVAARLRSMARELQINELIVNTITHSHEARLRSYTLLAQEFQLSKGS